MGCDKRLLRFGSLTLLEASFQSLIEGGCNPIIIVLEPNSSCIGLPLFRQRAESVLFRVLDEPSKSMAYSIRKGLEDVPQHSLAIAVLPGDCPAIEPQIIESLNRRFIRGDASLLVPTYAGHQGHPRYVGRSMFNVLRSLPEECRFSELFSLQRANVTFQEVGEASIIMDADTPEEYQSLLRRTNQKSTNTGTGEGVPS